MRLMGKLTARRVDSLGVGRHGDGGGLYLQVMSNGSRSWCFRYEVAGRERMMGLGATHTVSLKRAREKARQARELLLDGRDPLAERAAVRATIVATVETPTFSEAARQFFDTNEKRWRNAKHRAQFLSTLETYAYPVIGRKKVDEVDTPDVLRVIEPIWSSKTETASRVRGRIEKVLQWATTRGYRTGENPAAWRGHLANVLPPRSAIARTVHFRALPYAEVPAFVADLRQRDGIAARAVEFAVLTAARTGEVIGAMRDEFDLEQRVWTIPAARMKAGREHRVPLSDRAFEIVARSPVERGNPHLFVGSRRRAGLSNMSLDAVLRRMGMKDRTTVHGFRSSFRDWVAETTAFPNHVAEMALAHTIGDKVEAAYRRGDLYARRVKLMEAWAAYCHPPAGDKVVPIRRRGRK